MITLASTTLRLNDVTFGYQTGTPVVEALSTELEPGRLTALIGPNAAGKSTLLKLMLGQLDPWTGRVTLGDRNVSAMSEDERAAVVSYVPQRGALSFAFTVRQVVAMGRYAVGRDDAAVDGALVACDLTTLADRVYAHLSGGQQQRVLLARAMAQSGVRDAGGNLTLRGLKGERSSEGSTSGGGAIMLLDEPTASADLWHVHRTMSRLRELAGSGLAVLVVLHDLNLAARYADAVWLMDKGQLVAAGSWDAVLRPEVLEPAYRVSLRALEAEGLERPVFVVGEGCRA